MVRFSFDSTIQNYVTGMAAHKRRARPLRVGPAMLESSTLSVLSLTSAKICHVDTSKNLAGESDL
jgi:hypothetical protein